MKAKRYCHIAMASVCAFFAIGCVGEEIRWTEDVQLHGGRTVELIRRIDLTATGFPVQRRGIPKYYEFCYLPMGMHWKMRHGYLPDIFDIVDGRAYLHVPIIGCFQCKLHGFPKDNALAFVWENGAWKQIPYEAFPVQSQWNLLQEAVGADRKYAASGHITLAQKYKLDYGTYYEQKHQGWKRLSRQPSYPRCMACNEKSIGYTDDTGQIFLPVTDNTCNW